jgi:hypothetical protein
LDFSFSLIENIKEADWVKIFLNIQNYIHNNPSQSIYWFEITSKLLSTGTHLSSYEWLETIWLQVKKVENDFNLTRGVKAQFYEGVLAFLDYKLKKDFTDKRMLFNSVKDPNTAITKVVQILTHIQNHWLDFSEESLLATKVLNSLKSYVNSQATRSMKDFFKILLRQYTPPFTLKSKCMRRLILIF